MKPSCRKGGGSAPKVKREPVRVTITSPDSPYCGRKAVIRRVSYGAHVDLLVTLAGDVKITVDSTWTDYWGQKGEAPPPALLLESPDQARRLSKLLGRLECQADGAVEAGGSSEAGEVSAGG